MCSEARYQALIKNDKTSCEYEIRQELVLSGLLSPDHIKTEEER
jgi:hypothetical protein